MLTDFIKSLLANSDWALIEPTTTLSFVGFDLDVVVKLNAVVELIPA